MMSLKKHGIKKKDGVFNCFNCSFKNMSSAFGFFFLMSLCISTYSVMSVYFFNSCIWIDEDCFESFMIQKLKMNVWKFTTVGISDTLMDSKTNHFV